MFDLTSGLEQLALETGLGEYAIAALPQLRPEFGDVVADQRTLLFLDSTRTQHGRHIGTVR